METVWEILGLLGTGLGVAIIVLLCAVAIVLSCVSISGTWVVLGAAILALLMRGDTGFPGWLTLVVFLLLSIAVEAAEAVAGSWGVAKRGGSKLAGFASLIGGLVGLIVGSAIPIPFVGPLIGMLALSFGAAFLVEHWRLKHIEHAANIAWGAVWARVLVIFLKVIITLGMSAALLIGLVVTRAG
jgi:uncharacterized protein YqgC (DUF456 family)